MMAADGDYGPGYIGTESAYSQGGYETSQQLLKLENEAAQPESGPTPLPAEQGAFNRHAAGVRVYFSRSPSGRLAIS